jgi:hypothetical protein
MGTQILFLLATVVRDFWPHEIRRNVRRKSDQRCWDNAEIILRASDLGLCFFCMTQPHINPFVILQKNFQTQFQIRGVWDGVDPVLSHMTSLGRFQPPKLTFLWFYLKIKFFSSLMIRHYLNHIVPFLP